MIKQLRYHGPQSLVWQCASRFIVLEAGRRSGKTALAILDAILCALQEEREDGFFGVLAAPTRDQAKAIFWEQLKAQIPRGCIESISESELVIRFVNGNRLQVVGLDKPQRVEGRVIDKLWVDEVADMKQDTWDRNLRPALSTDGRPGKAWIFGVPRFSRQFADLAKFAQRPENQPEWAYFTWESKELLSPQELASARSSMDPLIFAQEYEAKRVNFSGRAYHQLDRRVHGSFELEPDLKRTLNLCFDFNNSPGVCAGVQELPPPAKAKKVLGDRLRDVVTSAVGEVYIPRNSNSLLVAEKAIEVFGAFKGSVVLWGDATGGAKHTSSVVGSDWDLITGTLEAHFGHRLRRGYGSSNPPERARINSVNARLYSADGKVGALVCPRRAPNLLEDLDETITLEGTAGELDKRDKRRTHASDAFGYYVENNFPVLGVAHSTSAYAH